MAEHKTMKTENFKSGNRGRNTKTEKWTEKKRSTRVVNLSLALEHASVKNQIQMMKW